MPISDQEQKPLFLDKLRAVPEGETLCISYWEGVALIKHLVQQPPRGIQIGFDLLDNGRCKLLGRWVVIDKKTDESLK